MFATYLVLQASFLCSPSCSIGKNVMEKILNMTNELQQMSKLVTFVDALSEELHLQPDVTFNLNLVLEEAVTNVILYAYPNRTNQPIILKVNMDDAGRCLSLTLIDNGIPFDPTHEAPEPDITLDAEARPIGGLGIFLIRKIMDTVEYQYKDGHNILKMDKRLFKEQATK